MNDLSAKTPDLLDIPLRDLICLSNKSKKPYMEPLSGSNIAFWMLPSGLIGHKVNNSQPASTKGCRTNWTY